VDTIAEENRRSSAGDNSRHKCRNAGAMLDWEIGWKTVTKVGAGGTLDPITKPLPIASFAPGFSLFPLL
jgi:hypothetical protein